MIEVLFIHNVLPDVLHSGSDLLWSSSSLEDPSHLPAGIQIDGEEQILKVSPTHLVKKGQRLIVQYVPSGFFKHIL